jgi:dihydroneopterin aldolase/2-amino-4-hydroxy-6-hydroxymethyldihydropteridine diphosphokinase
VVETNEDALDRIRLTGIGATGYHGVLEHERRDGQTFVADVVLHLDTRPAAKGDRVDLTVDYALLAEEVVAVLSGPAVDLLETVAERIAAVALEREVVRAVDVVVHKPEAPLTVPFGDVAVEVHRDRQNTPSVSRRAQRHLAEASPFPAPAEHAVRAVPSLDETRPAFPPVGDAQYLTPADLVAPSPVGELAGPVLAGPVPGMTAGVPTEPVAAPDAFGSAALAAVHGDAQVGVTVGASETPSDAPLDRLDVPPDEPVDVVIALGSNLGPSQDILRDAVTVLREIPGIEVHTVAPMARTAPVGNPDQQDFFNTVVLARTSLSPRALLHVCQGLEDRFGRVRDEPWGPRTLDVDIIVHGSTVAVADDLELPHPRAHERAFVLVPWAHVDPAAILPGLGGGPVDVLAETAPDRDGIRWMALDWWDAGARL